MGVRAVGFFTHGLAIHRKFDLPSIPINFDASGGVPAADKMSFPAKMKHGCIRPEIAFEKVVNILPKVAVGDKPLGIAGFIFFVAELTECPPGEIPDVLGVGAKQSRHNPLR